MLILLVGPKGSGKSYIGRLLESVNGVHFLDVESLWMAYYAECARAGRPVDIGEGVRRVGPLLRNALSTREHVAVETTGGSVEILEDLLAVGDEYGLLTIRVAAPLEVCLERIATRDQRQQIPTDGDVIRRLHRISIELDMTFDIVLENTKLTDERIVEIVSPHVDRRCN